MTESRVALITGGSRGLGQACALRLAEQGCNIAFCYANDDAGAKETQRLIEATGRKVLQYRADVRSIEEVNAFVTATENELGPVAILLNNAGITRDMLISRMTDEQWNDVININLTGAFNVTRRITPTMMKKRWGRIINMSSVNALGGAPGQSNYAAAKAGLIGMTRALARELGPRNITVNAIAPGPIETEMLGEMPQEWRDYVLKSTPLGRFGTSEDVSGVVAFLASDDASYITGVLFPVDGGLGMGH